MAVRNGFTGEIVLEESPKQDHHGQSNGEAERSVQTVQGMVKLDWRRKASPSSQHLLC